jgi:hypothetical protein
MGDGMTASISYHPDAAPTVESSGPHSWLRFAITGGASLAIHMPLARAERIAAAWDDPEDADEYEPDDPEQRGYDSARERSQGDE